MQRVLKRYSKVILFFARWARLNVLGVCFIHIQISITVTLRRFLWYIHSKLILDRINIRLGDNFIQRFTSNYVFICKAQYDCYDSGKYSRALFMPLLLFSPKSIKKNTISFQCAVSSFHVCLIYVFQQQYV